MSPAGAWSATPPAATRHAPRLGEHTAEVLAEAGLSASEIQAVLTHQAIEKEAL